jgi:hypothetical protein
MMQHSRLWHKVGARRQQMGVKLLVPPSSRAYELTFIGCQNKVRG